MMSLAVQAVVRFPILFLAQSAPATAPPAEPVAIQSVWDFVVKGGPTMAAIGLCSLVALTVIVERAVFLGRRNVAPRRFLSSLAAVFDDRRKALELCESDGSPIAIVLGALVRYRGRPLENVENAVRDAGGRAMIRLRHRMRLLSALPQVSTMLGLLGTIFGMIKTFQAVAASGQSLGKTEMLAKGIFEAWTNTAAGLIVAIPVLVAYHILMGRGDAMAAELDRLAREWIERDTLAPSSVEGTGAPAPAATNSRPVAAALTPSSIGLIPASA